MVVPSKNGSKFKRKLYILLIVSSGVPGLITVAIKKWSQIVHLFLNLCLACCVRNQPVKCSILSSQRKEIATLVVDPFLPHNLPENPPKQGGNRRHLVIWNVENQPSVHVARNSGECYSADLRVLVILQRNSQIQQILDISEGAKRPANSILLNLSVIHLVPTLLPRGLRTCLDTLLFLRLL